MYFAAEVMLIAFLNQGCERPSSGFSAANWVTRTRGGLPIFVV